MLIKKILSFSRDQQIFSTFDPFQTTFVFCYSNWLLIGWGGVLFLFFWSLQTDIFWYLAASRNYLPDHTSSLIGLAKPG